MRAILIIGALFALTPGMAQPDSTWVRYQGGMDLREGIYLDFPSFRMNAPSIPKDRLTDDQGRAVANIQKTRRLFRPDSAEGRTELDLDGAWGYCENNVVYLRAGNGFYRIGQFGALCHLVFEQSYWTADPYYGGMYGSGHTTVQRQYVLDMDSGLFAEFDPETLDRVLARDEVLHAEWRALDRKQQKREALYLFLRRYNERHPLYFPR